MSDCDFCGIVQGEQDAEVVLRTDEVVAFLPLKPATLGHTLIVPVQHIADIWVMTPSVGARLAEATTALAHAVRDAYAPGGLNIVQSNGAIATQTVPHLHVHVVPRYSSNDLGPIWLDDPGPTAQAPGAIAERLRQALAGLGGR